MPEFYIIIARKIVFPNFRVRARAPPVSYAYVDCKFMTFVVCDCTARTPRTRARCVTPDLAIRDTASTTSATADHQLTTVQNIPTVSTRADAT